MEKPFWSVKQQAFIYPTVEVSFDKKPKKKCCKSYKKKKKGKHCKRCPKLLVN